MKRRRHFARRRDDRGLGPEIPPRKRNGDIPGCKPRLTLIKLNLVYLKRVTFRLSDGMEIHVAGGEKHDRHIKTLGRIGGIDIRLQRLQIPIAPFLQDEVQFP